jgi:hypothetical protein
MNLAMAKMVEAQRGVGGGCKVLKLIALCFPIYAVQSVQFSQSDRVISFRRLTC